MRILTIGCGLMGQRHLRTLARLGRLEGVTAYDADAGRRAEALALGVRTVEDLEAALAERPTAVLICTPAATHVELAMRALEAGAHVFVERPLAPSLDGVEALVEAAEAAGRVLFVGYSLRFHAGLRALVQRARAGLIGPLWSIRAELGGTRPGPHGVLLDRTDVIDLACALMGDPERGSCLSQRGAAFDIHRPDFALLTLHTENGVAFSAQIDALPRRPVQRCELIGARGTLAFDHHVGLTHFDQETGRTEIEPLHIEANDMYADELACFLDCVAGHAKPPVDGRAAQRIVEIARSLVWAAGDRREVDLH